MNHILVREISWVNVFGFFAEKIMSFVNKDNFIFSLHICISCISFWVSLHWLILNGIMLKRSDEKEYLALSLIQMGKFQVSHLKMWYICNFCIYSLSSWKGFSLCTVFTEKVLGFFQNIFLYLLIVVYDFCLVAWWYDGLHLYFFFI